MARRFLLSGPLGLCLLLVPSVARAEPVVDMAVGMEHECTVNACGSVHCWGGRNQFFGEDADMGGSFDQVAVGMDHTCGLEYFDDNEPEAGGEVVCWGREAGALDEPEDWDLLEVPQVAFTQIEAGNHVTCGVKENDQVECWGWDHGGVVSNVPSNFYRQVSASNDFACGVTSGQSAVFCWGNVPAQLEEVYISDVRRYSTEKFVKVSAGADHVCAISEGSNLGGGSVGLVYCWGSNAAEQVNPEHPMYPGEYSAEDIAVEHQGGGEFPFAPVARHYNDRVTDVSAGGVATCIADANANVECWGYPFTPYGAGLTTWGYPSHEPPLGVSADRVFLGFHQVCAINDSVGEVDCLSVDYPNELGEVDPDVGVCL